MDWSCWNLCLLLCGIYFGCKILILWIGHFFYLLRRHFIPWIRKADLKTKYGPWAVVTGATSGIGLGLARAFADQGFNIVLISRNLSKLKTAAQDIEKEYNVKTKIITSEATDRKSYQFILEQLVGTDIGILVNNVATLSEEGVKPLCFHDTKPERVFHMNTVNCGAATVLMKGILPGMIERGRGLIVNMSSIAACYPISYQAHYSATKIYLEMVGDSLKDEIRGSGVQIKAIRPFIVQTQMTATNNLCYNFPLAQTTTNFASHVLPTLSFDNNSCGFWLTDFIMWTFTLWPEVMRYCIVTYTMKLGDKYGNVLELSINKKNIKKKVL